MTYLNELQEAIEALYMQFARYPLKSVIEGCPHCVSADDNEQLHTKPLRQLVRKDFRKYAYKALTTWGDDDDFRHFLPRILELVAFDEFAAVVDSEIVIGKLHYADWQTWNKLEIQAIHDYFLALWQYQLSAQPDGYDEPYIYPDAPLGDWLCTIAQAEDDLTPFLRMWSEMPSLPPILHLAQLINRNAFVKGSVHNFQSTFWQGRANQKAQVIDWLSKPEIAARLEAAFVQHVETDCADALALAIDNLAWEGQRTSGKRDRQSMT